MARLTLVFFGSFQAVLAGQPLRHLQSARLQALLAYLVLEAAHPHTRDELAARFWPDEPEVVAKQNLRQALYQLRQALDERTAGPMARETGSYVYASFYRPDDPVAEERRDSGYEYSKEVLDFIRIHRTTPLMYKNQELRRFALCCHGLW